MYACITSSNPSDIYNPNFVIEQDENHSAAGRSCSCH